MWLNFHAPVTTIEQYLYIALIDIVLWWWREHESSTTSRRCFVNFTGFQSVRESMTVYKCLHWLAPTYLADDCLTISAIAGKRHQRFAGTGLLSVPRTRTTLRMRSFAVSGSVIWNSLPAALRTAFLSPWRSLDIWRPRCLVRWFILKLSRWVGF